MYEITKTQQAKDDLKGIWHYSRNKWGESKATDYLLEIDDAIDQLRNHPELGRYQRFDGIDYRSLQVAKHVIYYRLQGDIIRIIRVLHERMDTGRHMQ